jgi:hypothetical protein
MKRPLTFIALALCLVLQHPLRAQFSPLGENQLFRVSAVGGLKTHYPLITLERSFGHLSASASIGGGYIGFDSQEALLSDENFQQKHMEVMNSKTLLWLPNSLGKNTYLSKTETRYTGAMLRAGCTWYFAKQEFQDHLSGFHAGIELMYLRIYEYQKVTYREISGTKTWVYDGLNQLNTVGVSLKAGYNWFPRDNNTFCLSAAIAHPFYIPFQEEINITSPFTASQWNLELGIGFRIKTR